MAMCFPRIRPRPPFSYTRRPLPFRSSSSATSTKLTSPKPQLPLFLRPLAHSATLSDLQNFRSWARELSISVGCKFSSDNGPEPDLLCREIEWLLQDTVENYSHFSQMGALQNDARIKLRVDLEGLYRLWERRIGERRPFQYIVGCEHWRDLILSVQEGVLIPRPETEQMVDIVGEVVSREDGFGEGLWADLGTGSGAIAIGVGRVLGPGGKVIASDFSPVAVSVATFNAERYGLQDKVEVRQGSWFEPLQDVQGKLEGLVSNPPYIPSDQISGLQAEVGRHEPRTALDGGKNGMDDLLHLCEGCSLALKPGGFFAFETNGGKQAEFIADFLSIKLENRFRNVNIVSDFAEIQRFVTGFLR